jgi:2-oxoglutarate ferredoxin oxidoreductase subunit delta
MSLKLLPQRGNGGGLHRIPIDITAARVPQGEVYVIPERCKGCGFCIAFCPEQVLGTSEGINPKGYHYPVVARGKEEACIHCGFCNLVCPDMAIYTMEVES